jgi:polysaccharide biosynthesis protein PslH
MRSLGQLGHDVALLTANDPKCAAIEGLSLGLRRTFAQPTTLTDSQPVRLSWAQERFRSYWGIDEARIRTVATTAEEFAADAVVVVGLNVLPYLGAVSGPCRIWYAADEWAWHHFSQLGVRPSTWGELKQAVLKGMYERAYRRLVDRVWVVTDKDKRAMRWVAGMANIDVIPNGVDGEYYNPIDAAQVPASCTFWGRLDFGPNIQALEWFCGRVWPLVRRKVPGARFTIYGFNPGPAVHALAGRDGVELVADLPDLRCEIARHLAVVLPFVSGGGIKNKLLEAASMGRAIVCARAACGGLRLDCAPPFLTARAPEDWVERLCGLWESEELRNRLGMDARRWVISCHSWTTAANLAASSLLTAVVPSLSSSSSVCPSSPIVEDS